MTRLTSSRSGSSSVGEVDKANKRLWTNHNQFQTGAGSQVANSQMNDLLKSINVVQVLSLGAIGLGFFLAIFAYRLLAREQQMKPPRSNILKATYVYMGFALVLVVLGIFGRYL